MNNGKQGNKKKLSILLLILLLLGLLTAAVLASRLSNQTKKKQDNYVDVNNGADKVTNTDVSSGATSADTATQYADGVIIVEKVEIFKISYNETGEVTVQTCDGDKLIAPGTDWEYDFTVRNTESFTMDYTLSVEAFVRGTDLTLPVLGRMKGPKGWMSAGEGDYVPVLDLDGLSNSGVLAGGHTEPYHLDWRWPFESASGDGLEEADAFDTMLGNMAVDKDLVLTIRFVIRAVEDENPDRPGGIPPTGDDFNIALWMGLMIVSLLVFIAVLAREKKRLTPAQALLAQITEEDKNNEDQKRE